MGAFNLNEILKGRRIGLDIGSHTIKLAEVTKENGGSYALATIGMIPTGGENKGIELSNAQLDPQKEELDYEVITKRLKELLKNNNINSAEVCSNIQDKFLITRYVEIPPMPEAEIKEAIKLKIKKFIPYSVERAVIDYIITSEKRNENNQLQALAFISKKNDIQDHVSMFRKCNLYPKIIDANSLALLNIFNHTYKSNPEELYSIVDFGESYTKIIIIKNQILRFTRSLAIGNSNIIRNLMSRLSIDNNAAFNLRNNIDITKSETILPTKDSLLAGLSLEQIQDAHSVTKSTLLHMCSELRSSFEFFRSQFREGSVNKLLICGSMLTLPSFKEFLSSILNIEIDLLRPLNNILVPEMKFDLEYLKIIEPFIAISLGLALR
ncbi:MAG: type IV pilus assembly protein PilM [bacterium]